VAQPCEGHSTLFCGSHSWLSHVIAFSIQRFTTILDSCVAFGGVIVTTVLSIIGFPFFRIFVSFQVLFSGRVASDVRMTIECRSYLVNPSRRRPVSSTPHYGDDVRRIVETDAPLPAEPSEFERFLAKLAFDGSKTNYAAAAAAIAWRHSIAGLTLRANLPRVVAFGRHLCRSA